MSGIIPILAQDFHDLLIIRQDDSATSWHIFPSALGLISKWRMMMTTPSRKRKLALPPLTPCRLRRGVFGPGRIGHGRKSLYKFFFSIGFQKDMRPVHEKSTGHRLVR